VHAHASSGSRLRVGVVGTGLIAQVMHLPYLTELSERYEVVALCDAVEEKAQACARRYRIPFVTTDWRELLERPLDAVLVLTSTSHAPIAIEAAGRGLHVLVEKPMCFSTAEGVAMVAAAARTGVTLMTAYNRRFDPAYDRFREEVRALSSPRLLRVTTFESPLGPYVEHYPLLPSAPPPNDVASRNERETEAAVDAAVGSGDETVRWVYRWVLLDTLVHELNAIRGVLGEPDSVDHADLRREGVNVMLRFGDLPVALHWVDLPGIARYRMEFGAYAPDRRVTLAFPSPFLRTAPAEVLIEDGEPGTPRSRETRETYAYENAFKRELIAFHAAVTEGTSLPTAGIDGLRDIALCQSIARAALDGRPVTRPSELPEGRPGDPSALPQALPGMRA
jgi:predicted dehydrogenase